MTSTLMGEEGVKENPKFANKQYINFADRGGSQICLDIIYRSIQVK